MPHHQYQALSACHINFKIRKFQLAVSTLKQDKPTGCSWKKNIWDHRYDRTYITIIWYVCICHLMSLLQREKEMEASHSSRVWKPHPSAYLFGKSKSCQEAIWRRSTWVHWAQIIIAYPPNFGQALSLTMNYCQALSIIVNLATNFIISIFRGVITLDL